MNCSLKIYKQDTDNIKVDGVLFLQGELYQAYLVTKKYVHNDEELFLKLVIIAL